MDVIYVSILHTRVFCFVYVSIKQILVSNSKTNLKKSIFLILDTHHEGRQLTKTTSINLIRTAIAASVILLKDTIKLWQPRLLICINRDDAQRPPLLIYETRR